MTAGSIVAPVLLSPRGIRAQVPSRHSFVGRLFLAWSRIDYHRWRLDQKLWAVEIRRGTNMMAIIIVLTSIYLMLRMHGALVPQQWCLSSRLSSVIVWAVWAAAGQRMQREQWNLRATFRQQFVDGVSRTACAHLDTNLDLRLTPRSAGGVSVELSLASVWESGGPHPSFSRLDPECEAEAPPSSRPSQ